jgi:hypothetical protein
LMKCSSGASSWSVQFSSSGGDRNSVLASPTSSSNVLWLDHRQIFALRPK